MTALPSTFRPAYEAEVGSLLSRRFKTWVLVWLLAWLPWVITYPYEFALCALVITVGGWIGMRRITEPTELYRLATWMLVIVSTISLIHGGLSIHGASLGGAYFWSGLSHFLTCLFLPLLAWQAARPAIAILLVWLVVGIWTDRMDVDFMMPISVAFASLILWPGVITSAFRMSKLGRQFESRMLRQHQQDFSREVFDARRFHEALFPPPQLEGAIQFRYIDLPRAGIGGDFLHAAFDAAGRLNLVVLDVSGDGISAALTVHRLQGELERIMAESVDQSIAPDVALESLDRYVRLTLAPMGIYAFALFFRIDRKGRVEWCGAGHTPAFIRRRDGLTEKLESTTWPLGASDEPDPLQRLMTTTLHPGDVLLAHTDGACEEINRRGERISYSGIERTVREAASPEDPFRWPEHFIELLRRFRGTGESLHEVRREDLLVVAVRISDPASTQPERP